MDDDAFPQHSECRITSGHNTALDNRALSPSPRRPTQQPSTRALPTSRRGYLAPSPALRRTSATQASSSFRAGPWFSTRDINLGYVMNGFVHEPYSDLSCSSYDHHSEMWGCPSETTTLNYTANMIPCVSYSYMYLLFERISAHARERHAQKCLVRM
jgi:hypothetical protein